MHLGHSFLRAQFGSIGYRNQADRLPVDCYPHGRLCFRLQTVRLGVQAVEANRVFGHQSPVPHGHHMPFNLGHDALSCHRFKLIRLGQR